MTTKTPAQLRSDDAVVLSDMLTKSGACQVNVAGLTGASRTVVQKWYDRLQPHLPHAHDIRRLPTALARVILDWCAEPHGLTVVERTEASGAASHLAQLHRILLAGSEATTEYCAAIGDGVITPDERERVISRLSESLAHQGALMQQLVREREADHSRLLARPRIVRGGAA